MSSASCFNPCEWHGADRARCPFSSASRGRADLPRITAQCPSLARSGLCCEPGAGHMALSTGATHPEHHLIPIKILPNNLIRSQTIITMKPTPHKYLSRPFAPRVSFGMVVSAGEVREAFVSSELADEPLRDVSLLDGRLSVGALGTSAPVSDDTLGFIS